MQTKADIDETSEGTTPSSPRDRAFPQTPLDASSDWGYWEQDPQHRFTHLTGPLFDNPRIDPRDWLGKTFWDIGSVPPAGDGWRRHKAPLKARAAFADLVFTHVDASGVARCVSASGQPRFDDQGRFKGFCGVARDLTARLRVERRLRAERAIACALEETGDLAETTARVMCLFGETFEWICGVFWKADAHKPLLHCERTWAGDPAALSHFLAATERLSPLPLGMYGLAQRAYAATAPVRADDRAAETLSPRAAAAGLRSGLAFPIQAGGHVLGVMEFFSREIRPPDPEMAGAAVFTGDAVGRFRRRHEAQAEALQLRTAIDRSPDIVCVADPVGMRLLYANDAACRLEGCTREEYLARNPAEVLRIEDEQLEHLYREVIASGDAGVTSELYVAGPDGRRRWVEARRRALRAGKRTLIVTSARDITRRKRAEQAARRRGRTYAALSAANEAILRARPTGDLLQRVCDAAVQGGEFAAAAVILPEADTGHATTAAFAGDERLHRARVALDETTPEGRLLGAVLRARRSGVDNDLANHGGDPGRVRAAAAVALVRDGQTFGALLFHAAERHAFDDEAVAALERMAGNIASALDDFERAAEPHYTRMYATLSATNEAILRARSPAELFRMVCEAAVHAGRFSYGTVLVPRADAWVFVVAGAGAGAETMRDSRFSVDAHLPEGRGLVGTALRSLAPAVSNDLLNDERTLPWREVQRRTGARAAAVTPIVCGGRAVGALALYAREPGAFDGAIVKLLERMARNIAFALDNFEREAERRQTEERLRQSEARFRALTDLSSDWYWELDPELRFTRFEGRRLAAGGRAYERCLGKRPWELGVEAQDGWEAQRARVRGRKRIRDLLLRRVTANGRQRCFSVSAEPVLDAAGRFIGYRGVGRDVTQQKRAEERIQQLATRDALTGLPNRAMFSDLLHVAAQAASRYQRKFALLFIDLDRFKIINDTLGHEAGDRLLQEMARRLKQALRASDIVARLGGDEFVVLLQETNDASEAAMVARKILAAAAAPVTLAGHECRVTASIGVCMYPGDAQDEQWLMKNGEAAMYRAKAEGKNTFQFASKGTSMQSLEKLALETNLRRALERDEFALHYQPQVDLQTGRVIGVEALLRWNSPELGVVAPERVIPLAEETGLIVSIGRWVLRTACMQNVAWESIGLPPLRMAVNLSARQFADEGLLADIAAALRDSGMAPELLELEITEGTVAHDVERAVAVLNAIKQMGVRLAIDDFGTGYSSLAQIRRFPIDTLKVDRSFIREIPGHAEDRAIAEAVIVLAKTLHLTVVAEGVETEAQASFLKERGCDQAQGFYFGKPLPREQIRALFRTPASPSEKRPAAG